MKQPASEDDHPPFYLTSVDREVLAQTDDEFHLQTWDDLYHIIAENRLSTLKRKPSDLIRYIAWTRQTIAEYGSIIAFICQQRLHWEPLPSSSSTTAGLQFEFKDPIPFADKDDYKILRNDWPYGLEAGITHMVVWLKTPIPVDSTTGVLTGDSRRRVEEFVRGTFEDRLARDVGERDRVVWFKNWTQLQSVRGLEHIHVLVRDVPEKVMNEWTGEVRLDN